MFLKLFFDLNKIEDRGQLEAYGSYWKKQVYWDKIIFCGFFFLLNIQIIFPLIHSPNLSLSAL